jgi:hypothetical protein
MTFTGVNYLAILVAAVAGWVIGAAWYMSLSKQWMAAHGKTPDQFKAEAEIARGASPAWLPFPIAFIAELIMAWVLAGLLAHLGPVQTNVWNGVVSAAFVWVGFVATTVAVNNMFSSRKFMLTVIDGGHWLAVLLAMGIVLGLFGV